MSEPRLILRCPRCATDQYVTPSNDFYDTELWHGKEAVCESCFRHLVRATNTDISEFRTILEEGR